VAERIKFTCPICAREIYAPPSLAGEAATCPQCHKHVNNWVAPQTIPSGTTVFLHWSGKVLRVLAPFTYYAICVCLLIALTVKFVGAIIAYWEAILGVIALILYCGVSGAKGAKGTTLRPLNFCTCGHTWFSRGRDYSLRCPSCGR